MRKLIALSVAATLATQTAAFAVESSIIEGEESIFNNISDAASYAWESTTSYVSNTWENRKTEVLVTAGIAAATGAALYFNVGGSWSFLKTQWNKAPHILSNRATSWTQVMTENKGTTSVVGMVAGAAAFKALVAAGLVSAAPFGIPVAYAAYITYGASALAGATLFGGGAYALDSFWVKI